MSVADANVLIALLNAADVHHDRAVELADEVDQTYVHALTMAEVLGGYPDPRQRLATYDALMKAGFTDPEIPYEEEVNLLASVRVRECLTMPDACVLATALWQREPLLTFDARVATAARAHGLVVRTLAGAGS